MIYKLAYRGYFTILPQFGLTLRYLGVEWWLINQSNEFLLIIAMKLGSEFCSPLREYNSHLRSGTLLLSRKSKIKQNNYEVTGFRINFRFKVKRAKK